MVWGFASLLLIKSERRRFPQVNEESGETAPEPACCPPPLPTQMGQYLPPRFWILPVLKATIPPDVLTPQPHHHGHHHPTPPPPVLVAGLGVCSGWSGWGCQCQGREKSPAHCHQPCPASWLSRFLWSVYTLQVLPQLPHPPSQSAQQGVREPLTTARFKMAGAYPCFRKGLFLV